MQLVAQVLYFMVFIMLFLALAIYIGNAFANYRKESRHKNGNSELRKTRKEE